MPKLKRKWGWKPDVPDARDKRFECKVSDPKALPVSVDLRPDMPLPYDQKQLGSCVGCAVAGAIHYLVKKTGYKWQFTPSRLFIYYNARVIEGTVMSDAGAMIRDGVKTVNAQGVCPEDSSANWNWSYSDDPVRFRLKPFPQCYKDALLHQAIDYSRVDQNLTAMQACLAAGFPIVLGISVYDSFEGGNTAQTGDIPMPNTETESLLGGHAILIVGYDSASKRFIFRNSWGTGWGNHGYGTLSFDYLTNSDLCDDLWVIKLIQNK